MFYQLEKALHIFSRLQPRKNKKYYTTALNECANVAGTSFIVRTLSIFGESAEKENPAITNAGQRKNDRTKSPAVDAALRMKLLTGQKHNVPLQAVALAKARKKFVF